MPSVHELFKVAKCSRTSNHKRLTFFHVKNTHKQQFSKGKRKKEVLYYGPWLTGSDSKSDGCHMTSMGVKNKSCEGFLKIVTISFFRDFYDVNVGFIR